MVKLILDDNETIDELADVFIDWLNSKMIDRNCEMRLTDLDNKVVNLCIDWLSTYQLLQRTNEIN